MSALLAELQHEADLLVTRRGDPRWDVAAAFAALAPADTAEETLAGRLARVSDRKAAVLADLAELGEFTVSDVMDATGLCDAQCGKYIADWKAAGLVRFTGRTQGYRYVYAVTCG